MKYAKKHILGAGSFLLGLSYASLALAGPSTDALSECLVRSTTPEDHIVLVDWIFTVIARHPSVVSMASITDAQRVEVNRKAGALYTRLLTDACAAETKQAYKEDGEPAIEAAFSTLGATAMKDLMSNADVQAGSAEVGAYFDEAKLQSVLGDPAAAKAK